MPECWIYHQTEEPMIVGADEAESFYSDGWSDSPAKFIKTTDFGIEPEDKISVQQLGETIEGIKKMANGALNLKEMSFKELDGYAKTNFNKRLKGNSKVRRVEEIEALING
ncbi:MAG: hypothetical protein V3T88_02420 [Nitrosomonadaceae bacterium]